MTRQILARGRTGLAVGGVVAAFVTAIWAANLFIGTRLALSDLFYVPTPTTGDVVLVAIDNTTLEQYGSLLSWDRTRYADALDALTDAGARVVAFDILFSEEKPEDPAFAAALERARAAGTSTVLAVSGVGRLRSDEPMVTFQQELRPVDTLADAATHLAYVNAYPDADSTLRRTTSQGRVVNTDTVRLSLPLAAYLARSRVSAALVPQVITMTEDTLTLPSERVLTLEDDGMWMFNYYDHPGEAFETVSFVDIADTPAETFKDKIVLVGLMNLTGAVDQYATPTSAAGTLMPGVEIHAHSIETLIRNQPLHAQKSTAQAVTFILAALLTGIIIAPLRWHGMLGVGILILAGWAIYASTVFSAERLVVNALHPPLAIFLTILGSIGVRASLDFRARRQAETLLSSLVRVAQQRMDMSRIATLVAQDIETVVGSGRGGLWALENNEHLMPMSCPEDTLPRTYQTIVQKAYNTEQIQQDNHTLALPVIYSGRVLAILLAIEVARPAKAAQRLERFAKRVAPNLANAMLYEHAQQQNHLLNNVLAASPAGILVLDKSLNVLHTNDAVAKWMGLASVTMKNQPFSALLEQSNTDEAMWETVGAGLMDGARFRHELKLGQQTLQLDAASIPEDGRWVLTFSDITDLAELSRIKTQMLRMASHDLKNPLGRVIGYADLLTDNTKDNGHELEYGIFLKRIKQAGEEMLKLITEILDLEHIRSGKAFHEPLNLQHLVLDVVQRYTDQAEEKNQTLNQHLAGDLPLFEGDYNQLVQAVSNLVGNAIKYTPNDGEITLQLAQHDESILLEVTDTGYGMPEEAQAKLFTEFYRVRTEATQDIPGTGLGLSLVKSVVEAHGGRIWVDSELDVGSTFHVELPLNGGETTDE